MITDRPKLTTNIALYGMSSFHFTARINLKWPWAVLRVQGTYVPHFRQRSMSSMVKPRTLLQLPGFRHAIKAD